MPIFRHNSLWILETAASGYAFGLNPAGLLAHAYWGPRLPFPSDYPLPPNPAPWASFNGAGQLTPEEYATYAGPKYTDPSILLTLPDGVRDLVLTYEDEQIVPSPQPELHLHFRDAHYPVKLTLHYRLYEDCDLIERWVTLSNQGPEPLIISRLFSALWNLPPGDNYRLTHLTGRWLDEMHLRRDQLTHGIKTIESRRLTSSHHHAPWFAVDDGRATEDHGQVWFGGLAWSGNWKLAAEVTDFQSTRLNIGLNDWDFAWTLPPGESFTTPAAFAGITLAGFGAASRLLHDHIRDHILPHGKTLHKVLYNSWEATLFDVDEPSQTRLAEVAADMGIELFVMDDGWFHGRKDDHAGLGDWWPDEKKFPAGLAPLIERVNALGMDFGLWIEPEMVNPDSDLYRAHPDWVIHFPNRERSECRNQLILNFARPDVQEVVFSRIDKLLTDHNIVFIKWDMNRNVSEPGWPGAPGDQREIWVRYVQGLYAVWGRLAERHPRVIWQSCSGGGGRGDLGILRLADQIWVSDNTAATSRLAIQEGFSHIFPANVMEAWVTDAGKELIPLEFRFHVSMCGSLGIGGHLLHWSEADRALAAALIAQYKEIRPIIQFGDQYRLRSAQETACPAVLYLNKEKTEGVLFAFRILMQYPSTTPRLHLQGLIPNRQYQIEGFEQPRSGAAWMADGLQIDLNDLQSTLRRIKAVPS
ncbi:MAG TPA: alpha-galactosidase [Anaerolineaceae bacterium]|nr:alpha-galactosidase [Anaerolineaceae bacterium]HPN52882.1 alpha-galactosidase [Anaerolineaceae bacterium]